MSAAEPIQLRGRARAIALVLLGLYVAWLAVGIFPVSPVEGDEQGVINGAVARARGEAAYYRLAYSPEIQPGAIALLAAASRWTGLAVEPLFAAGTVLGAVLFALLAARLLAHVLSIPFLGALAAMLWCQETSAAAYYMNTTALGLWLTFVALVLACRRPTGLTLAAMAACIAAAGWIRIDCLLPTPAIPVLLALSGRGGRSALTSTAAVAAGSLGVVLVLYRASGVTAADIATLYAGRGAVEGWWPTVRSLPLLLSPLVCLLAVAGVALLVIRRDWRLLALIAAGIAATLPVYGTSLASTKYFYHLVPFFLLAALYAVRTGVTWLQTRPAWACRGPRGALVGLAVLAAVADQGIGLQTSSPEFRRYVPAPTVAALVTFRGPRRRARVVIGPGEIIPTTDGFRLRTGALFAPWIWHREKTAMLEQLRAFGALLRAAPRTTVYFSGWLPYQMAVRLLRAEGFRFTSSVLTGTTMPFAGDWNDGPHRVHLDYLAYQASPYFDRARHPGNPTGTDTYFVGDLSGTPPITELADGGRWTPLWPRHLYRFITFFQRRPLPTPP